MVGDWPATGYEHAAALPMGPGGCARRERVFVLRVAVQSVTADGG